MSAVNPIDRLGIHRRSGQLFPLDRKGELFAIIDQSKEFYGAGVVYMDSYGNFEKLRPSCRTDDKTVVIMQRTVRSLSEYQAKVQNAPQSSWKSESLSAALSCGSAGITWLLLFGEGLAGEVTLGATWAAMPLTTASALASSASCGVATGRLINAASGNAENNDWLDADPIYRGTMLALDVVQVADVIKSLGKSAELVKLLRSKAIGSKGVLAAYKGLDRASRKRLAEELLKLDHKALASNKKAIRAILEGKTVLPMGKAATKVYSQTQVQALLQTKLKEFCGSLLTTIGSANGGTIGNGVDFLIGIVGKQEN